MLPDLRPSRPLSTGPTLFLAPSPTAWQARHLLNDVLPASASCASALEAAVVAAITNSVLKVSFFMGYSSLPGLKAFGFCHGRLAKNNPSDGSSVFQQFSGRSVRPLTGYPSHARRA